MSKRSSTRSCICCRLRAEKKDLLRFVLQEGQIVWDREHTLPGRGAYVHPRLECWLSMASTKLWERAFRLKKGELSGSCLKDCMDEIRVLVDELSDSSVQREVSPKLRL